MTRTCDRCTRPLPESGFIPTRRIDHPTTGVTYLRYCNTRCKVRSMLATDRGDARHA